MDCERGLAANPASPFPLANLLYDMCLIEQHDGHLAAATANCERSLAIRTDKAGRDVVSRELCRIHCREQRCTGAQDCWTAREACVASCR